MAEIERLREENQLLRKLLKEQRDELEKWFRIGSTGAKSIIQGRTASRSKPVRFSEPLPEEIRTEMKRWWDTGSRGFDRIRSMYETGLRKINEL